MNKYLSILMILLLTAISTPSKAVRFTCSYHPIFELDAWETSFAWGDEVSYYRAMTACYGTGGTSSERLELSDAAPWNWI